MAWAARLWTAFARLRTRSRFNRFKAAGFFDKLPFKVSFREFPGMNPKKNPLRGIPENVFIFGLVSYLTDVSSDMIYPLLPIFLTQTLGAGEGFVGLVEGFAESTAAFFMLLSGLWADRSRDRSRLVMMGYSLSAFSKPLVAFAWNPWVVFFVRCADRVGKGIRTSPRDALIADSVPAHARGKAFGLQRSLDHAGAVTGPILATLLLTFWIQDLRHLFLIAVIPGLLAVALIAWKVREVSSSRKAVAYEKVTLKAPSGKLRIYLMILFLFILGCSSDAFLLLRAAQLGVPHAMMPILWLLLNLVKALTTLPLGALSDRLGRRRVILMGWIVYALVYVGFAFASTPAHAWILFACYGLFYGFTEGGERAILADYSGESGRGQAYGWYYFTVGAAALPASLMFGFVWQVFGSTAAFLMGAGLAALACVLLALFLYFVPSAARTSGENS